MWLLDFLASYLFGPTLTILIIVSSLLLIAALIAKFVFPVEPYVTAALVVAPLLLSFGFYFKGRNDVEIAWREKVVALEKRVAVAEQEAKDANERVVERVVEKIKIVKEVQHATAKEIEKSKAIIDRDCELHDLAIMLHDRSSQNSFSPGPKHSNGAGTKPQRSGSRKTETKRPASNRK